MSFILDALKKSEIERRAGTVPGLEHASSYVIASGHRPGHVGLPLLLGSGMLVLGLILGGWRSWNPSAPVRISPAVALSHEPVFMPAQPQAPAIQQPAVIRPAAPIKVTPPSIPLATVPPRAPAKIAVAAETRSASKPSAQSKTQTGAAASGKPANVVADAAIRPAPVAVPSARVLDYRELPVEVRAGLPKVVFGGYAGVDDAEVRIAFINNQLVKEGEEVSPGLKLEQVGREGVILGYKGLHFRPGS